MTPTLRLTIIFTIVAGAIAGTYLLDINPNWSGLIYLGCVALWFAITADTPPPGEE
jgi:1,4-dihydroxy-2-naphthoate octaprenyltransferase